jgi:hypothetical protein
VLATIRRLPRTWRRYKAARLEAEALVFHHGQRRVAIAEARAAAAESEDHEIWCYRRLVARIARQRHDFLERSDTATRYELVEDW